MNKVKKTKKVVVEVSAFLSQVSEESSESELEELMKTKATKKQIVQQKKKVISKPIQPEDSEEDSTPPAKVKKPTLAAEVVRGRKISVESEESVPKDKVKKIVKNSGEPIRKKSLDKPKKKTVKPPSSEEDQDSEPQLPKKGFKKAAIPAKGTGKGRKQ